MSAEDGGLSSGVAPRNFKSKLEEALTAKQEFEAKSVTLEDRVKKLEEENTTLKTQVLHMLHCKIYGLQYFPCGITSTFPRKCGHIIEVVFGEGENLKSFIVVTQ